MSKHRIIIFILKMNSRLWNVFNDLPLAFRGLILGPLILIIAISINEWINLEYPSRPPSQFNSNRIQHPNYHNIATLALRKFSALTPEAKDSLLRRLESNITPIGEWLAQLNKLSYQMLCLGESHVEYTRKFLAEEVFNKHGFDTLYLEATENQLSEINQRLSADSHYYPMLGADILQLLRSVKKRNPTLKVHGIEVNEQQIASQGESKKSRDDLILDNFWLNYRPQTNNIVLIGAMHCSDSDSWFYAKMKREMAKNNIQRINNIRVLSEHEEGPIEAFVYFLDEIGIEQADFVITNTDVVASEIRQLFPLITKFILEPYQTVVVYR